MTRPDLDVMEAVARIQQALSIAAGWARTKGDSQNARDKIKAGLDACLSIKSHDAYIRELEGALEKIELQELPLRYEEDDDTDYFLRAIRNLKAIARTAHRTTGGE